ncbi:hypothetical protein SNEBB_005000 [Seison nebaliae]|nr:hypothetical protein SNEBB_005000 [Seison nebaliae]
MSLSRFINNYAISSPSSSEKVSVVNSLNVGLRNLLNGFHRFVIRNREYFIQFATFVVTCSVSFYLLDKLLGRIDPYAKDNESVKTQLKLLAKNLPIDISKFDQYESIMFVSSYVSRDQLDVGWDDVAGLSDAIKILKQNIIYPLRYKDRLTDFKLKATKGVLLHGKPGCGKTLLAKALAKESNILFLNIDIASILEKYYGESQKRIRALFSLADKIKPCIVFIDELDSLLRTRSAFGDHESTAMIKTQFMTLLDGLLTDDESNIILIGATNRFHDVDQAIRRRLPVHIEIKLPDLQQRHELLNQFLKVQNHTVDIDRWADEMEGKSCADIKEVCRRAINNRNSQIFDSMEENTTNDISNIPITDVHVESALTYQTE